MEIKFFKFEAELVQSLRCVPMIVRYKLDQSGIKLPLRAWSRADVATRSKLVGLPVDGEGDLACYREFLLAALDTLGEPAKTLPVDPRPAWKDTTRVPHAVAQMAEAVEATPIEPELWAHLTELQRFALTKLTRPGHENADFLPALKEFGLYEAEVAERPQAVHQDA